MDMPPRIMAAPALAVSSLANRRREVSFIIAPKVGSGYAIRESSTRATTWVYRVSTTTHAWCSKASRHLQGAVDQSRLGPPGDGVFAGIFPGLGLVEFNAKARFVIGIHIT